MDRSRQRLLIVTMNITAVEHLLETSRSQGIGTQVPESLKEMLEKTAAAGHGDNSYMAMIDCSATSDADSPEVEAWCFKRCPRRRATGCYR